MVAREIEDIKGFTSDLFVGTKFDSFLLKEARFVTFAAFDIDGKVREDYYTREEREEGKIGEYSAWSALKPVCYFLIKGKRLPGSFKLVFKLPSAAVERFLRDRGLPFAPDQVEGLYLNIRYEEQRLVCVTGTSVRMFTLDKTLEQQWDAAAGAFIGAQRSL